MATSLREMTALNQFPQTEKLFQSIPPAPKGYLGPAETATADVEMMQAKDIARENVGKADIAIEQARRDEKTAELTSQAELEKEFAERRKNMPQMAALKEGREKLRGMEFVPTKDTVQDIAGLFSLIGVIGMAVGGGGRMASQQAMGAMNGMMEGYRKGRTDLFKKEQIEFDKNFKAMQTAVSSLKDEYSEALEIEKTDKEAGRIARAMALNKAGSPVLKAMEAKQGAVNVMNTINDLDKSVKTSVTQANTLRAQRDKAEADERRFKLKMEQSERIARENRIAADERARLGRLDKEGKLSPKERGEVRGINNLSDEIQRLKDTFKPEFVNFKADVLGDVAAKFRSRIADDPAMAEWWRRYENVAIPERHSMFGATLTGNERDAWRKASIGTGNSTKEVLSWIADKQQALNNKLAGYETTAASRPSQPTQGQYQINQIITQDNKRYRIIGLDDPNDPDVEEVQ